MKTKIFTFLLVAIGLMASISAFAENETQVSKGAEITYTVKGTSTYDWKVLNSDYSLASGTTDYTASLGTTATNKITWKLAGTYYLSIVGTDVNGCKTDPFVTKITVTNAELCIAQVAGTLPGGTAVVAPNNKETCSLVDTDPSTSSTIATGNVSSSGADIFTFDATIIGATAAHTYTIAYKVGGTDGLTTSTIVTNNAGEGKIQVSIKTTDYPIVFNNLGANDSSVKIEVVSMTDGTWTSTDLCTNASYNITVKAKPTVSF